MSISSVMKEKKFQQKQTVNNVDFGTMPIGYKLFE